jgi:hypothetical protein
MFCHSYNKALSSSKPGFSSSHSFNAFTLFCQLKRAATRVQTIWRSYLYKKAYTIAPQQQHENRTHARYILYQELRRNTPDIGDHVEILFDAKKLSESIYSGQVQEVQYRGDWVKIKVKFHSDGEVR